MKSYIKFIQLGLLGTFFTLSSCDKNLDINTSPNALTAAPIQNVLTNITVNVGFTDGSDIHRFTALWVQQFAGQGAAGTQNLEYERYNIQSTDVNNLWSTYYATILPDCDYIIANSPGSPHYSGLAKVIKAYVFSKVVDMWGDAPYSEALKGTAITAPKYDDDAAIYPQLITLINDGITELGQATSAISPGTNETIYGGNRTKWIKFANTFKLRLFLRYSEINPAQAKTNIDALIASAGTNFILANADNFQMPFVNATNAQNPIDQFEVRRLDQFFPHKNLVDMMNGRLDPRRPFYFTPFPYNSSPATYRGALPGEIQSWAYSRLHTFLRGAQTKTPVMSTGAPNTGGIPSSGANAATYTGDAPIRMLTFAEYNFIRAEAALRFASPGSAQTFFTAAITASMENAGVLSADIATYIAANGTLSGTPAQQLQRIIEEKYIANYGVSLEPYNDYRRTGYPVLTPSPTSVLTGGIPTIYFYPQSEINSNPNAVQKTTLFQKVFWDN
ncbi:MAG: SusD/RagB family nutrient-binding outer membrane lipoprotein [Bacteroidota bacterium]|nr:SusD/RagB family nutrient-binding outer membrane lipoprotein [Bacteroidota bacterium]